MTKEALILVLVVGAIAVGIVVVVQKASSNEPDWDSYRAVELGDTRTAVLGRFSTVSEDFQSMADATGLGYQTDFKEMVRAGGGRLIVVRSQSDAFVFGFDKEDKLVFKNFRRVD